MYIKFLPSEYVFKYKKGKVVKEGVGLSFFSFAKSTSACALPISQQDVDFIFEEQTNDFQTVSVQGQLTYRISDYKKISEAMDFTVKLRTKEYYDTPMEKLSKRIINIAEVILKGKFASINLTDAIQANEVLAKEVLAELVSLEELKQIGIMVNGFSILAIVPGKETLRALEAKTREEILKNSDDALYERRNASIEQERKVKENELNTEITIEEKKKLIRESEINTRRMVLERENELEKMKAYSEAERKKIEIEAEIEIEKKRKELAELRLENAKKDADAEAYRVGAVMEAYNKLGKEALIALATLNMEPEKIFAQAFDKLAVNSEKIGSLNISPDLIESLRAGA